MVLGYITYLKKNWLSLVTCIVLGASLFIVYTVFEIPNKYDATAVVTTDQKASSYIKIIKSDGYINDVSNQYSLSKDEVSKAINIEAKEYTLRVTARTTEAMTSKKIVDTLIVRLTKNHPQVKVKSNATVESQPSSPSLLVNGALGGLCGGLVGLIIIGITMIKKRKDQVLSV